LSIAILPPQQSLMLPLFHLQYSELATGFAAAIEPTLIAAIYFRAPLSRQAELPLASQIFT
jgi:hypothetical protein